MSELFKLGNYEITSIIGRGAMGVVYKAFDPTIQQEVAIKTIRKDLLEAAKKDSGSTQIAERFRMEVLAGRRLKHANIVRIYEYGITDDSYYIVMEFVQGRSLQDYFNNQHRFDLKTALDILVQILDALGYAHRQGVVHRDIKPANIMLSEQYNVQIADFGVAKVFDASVTTLTGYAVGTPSYMAPEQWNVKERADGRADLFSLGIILYQFLTGRHPFRGATTPETIEKIRTLTPPAPSTLEPTVPTQFDAIVNTALQKDPQARYQSADEFLQDLRTVSLQAGPSTTGQSETTPRQVWQSLLISFGSLALGLSLAWLVVKRLSGPPTPLPTPETSVSSNIEPSTAQSTKPLPTVAASSVQALEDAFPCAHLETAADSKGSKALRGFVQPQELDQLKHKIKDVPGLEQLNFQVQPLKWPYCELFGILSPYKRGNKWEFAEAQYTRHYIEGDPMVLGLTAPNYAAYVYVDYYQLDGSVIHLFPLTADENRRQPANSKITIGDTADHGHEWRIQPPFGTEMIVVMAATDPLFGILRPEHEHARDYLKAVRAAVADGQKKQVTADYYFIHSQPKPAP